MPLSELVHNRDRKPDENPTVLEGPGASRRA
jgi:hypothetical protein